MLSFIIKEKPMCSQGDHAWFDSWSDGPFTCEDVQQMISDHPDSARLFHLMGHPDQTFDELGCPEIQNRDRRITS